MDLTNWLSKQKIDASPMGRLISYAAADAYPEEFFVSLSRGKHATFGREYRALAQGVISQFKREGGKFENPSWFAKVPVARYIGGDVIAFRPRPAVKPMSAHDLYWTRFYGALLGIDFAEAPLEVEKRQIKGTAEITVLKPDRITRKRRHA